MKQVFFSTMIVVLISMGFMACTKSSSYNSSNPTTATVNIKDMQFSPTSVTIAAGGTVTWTNNDSMTHTVTSTGSAFNSGNLATGKTYSFTFSTKGTYPYTCTIHPSMTGTVIVN